MKKNALALGTAISIVAASNLAIADSTADLNVTGSFRPSTCLVVIAGGHKFNFGTIKTDDLHPTQQNHFDMDKVITISCPTPTGIWVAFPFDNGGLLQPHEGGVTTGRLAWWSQYNNGSGSNVCDPNFPEHERVKIDTGDGLVTDNRGYVRIYSGTPTVLECSADSYFNIGDERLNGSEDGFYIGANAVKFMHIPRILRMTVNPRDSLVTSGAIPLRGGAIVVVNYI